MTPIIDIYCHIYPDQFYRRMTQLAPNLENMGSRLRRIKKLFDLDVRFAEMDELGDYRQVISLPNPPIEDIVEPGVGMALCRIANDEMAELCRRHPDRFPAFVAAVCLTDVDGSIDEIQRAVGNLGACGALVYTSIAGEPLDQKKFEPFFAAIAKLGVPIWLHPARTSSLADYPAEEKSRYEMWWCFGWPYDTSVAMVRLVFAGIFDRYPNLRIITHHLGGMIPYYDGRVGQGLEVLGARTTDEDYSQVLSSLKRPHMDYLREFYADTALFGGGEHAIRCGLDFFGIDRVVFATDAPLGPIGQTIAKVDRLELSAEDRQKIMHGNAEKLLQSISEEQFSANLRMNFST